MLQLRFVIRERGVGENEKEEKIGKTEILVFNVMEWGGGMEKGELGKFDNLV